MDGFIYTNIAYLTRSKLVDLKVSSLVMLILALSTIADIQPIIREKSLTLLAARESDPKLI